jgi:hypothetical protein
LEPHQFGAPPTLPAPPLPAPLPVCLFTVMLQTLAHSLKQ